MRMTIDAIENVMTSYTCERLTSNDGITLDIVGAPDAAWLVINKQKVCKIDDINNLLSDLQDLQDALKECCGIY